MRARFWFVCVAMLIGSFSLYGFDLVSDYKFLSPSDPIHVEVGLRDIGSASVKGSNYSGKISYNDGSAGAFYSFFIDPDNALSVKLGLSHIHMRWKDNPFFSKSDYWFASSSLAWISTSIPDWRWITRAAISLDAQTGALGSTGVYYGMLWGRYRFLDHVGIHVGASGYYGVKNGYLLPIFGFDWRFAPQWSFYCIFPLNLSLSYHLTPLFSTSIGASSFGGPYRFPIRIKGGIGSYKDGIFEVYSTGLEWDFKLEGNSAFFLRAGLGWNLGGWLYVKNSHNKAGHYVKFKGAPYGMGEIGITF